MIFESKLSCILSSHFQIISLFLKRRCAKIVNIIDIITNKMKLNHSKLFPVLKKPTGSANVNGDKYFNDFKNS